MKDSTNQSRRKFLKTAALAGGVFSIVPRHVLGGPGYTAPSDELTKAVIGVGGMGPGILFIHHTEKGDLFSLLFLPVHSQ